MISSTGPLRGLWKASFSSKPCRGSPTTPDTPPRWSGYNEVAHRAHHPRGARGTEGCVAEDRIGAAHRCRAPRVVDAARAQPALHPVRAAARHAAGGPGGGKTRYRADAAGPERLSAARFLGGVPRSLLARND